MNDGGAQMIRTGVQQARTSSRQEAATLSDYPPDFDLSTDIEDVRRSAGYPSLNRSRQLGPCCQPGKVPHNSKMDAPQPALQCSVLWTHSNIPDRTHSNGKAPTEAYLRQPSPGLVMHGRMQGNELTSSLHSAAGSGPHFEFRSLEWPSPES